MPLRKYKVTRVRTVGVDVDQTVVIDRELVTDPEDTEAATMNAGLPWSLRRDRYAPADVPEGMVLHSIWYVNDSATP